MRMFRPGERKPVFSRSVIDSLPRGRLLLLDTQGRFFRGGIGCSLACIEACPKFAQFETRILLISQVLKFSETCMHTRVASCPSKLLHYASTRDLAYTGGSQSSVCRLLESYLLLEVIGAYGL